MKLKYLSLIFHIRESELRRFLT